MTYSVAYKIKTCLVDNGEFSTKQTAHLHVHMSKTNDLGEIFTDLYDLHRDENILGLEVLSVDAQEFAPLDHSAMIPS